MTLGRPTLSTTGLSTGGGSTVVQTSLPEAGVLTRAPADGVITQWRVVGQIFGDGALRLRVVSPADGGMFTGSGTSAPATAIDGTALPTNLAIHAGDFIAFDSTATASMGNGALVYTLSGSGQFSKFTPQLADGSTIGPTSTGVGEFEFNADVLVDAPVVSGVGPGVGSGGQAVTITGQHLANATGVSFGSVPAGIVSNSNTQIVAIAPSQPPGTVDVRVTAIGGTSATSTADQYVYAGAGGNGAGGAAPAVSSARLSSTIFRAAATGASLTRKRQPPVGTTVSYRASQAATTTFTVLKPTAGHKKGRLCVAGRPHKRQVRCTRYVPVGSFTHQDQAGNVKIHFSGRVRGRKLSPGRYRLTLTPKANGKTGRTLTLAFQIVK